MRLNSAAYAAKKSHICEPYSYATMKRPYMHKLSVYFRILYSQMNTFHFEYVDFFANARSFRLNFTEYSSIRPQL